MTDDYLEFRTHYIKGAGVYFLLYLAGILSAFSIFMILLIMNIWITLIFALPALALPFVLLILKSRKVRIGTDYVESITFFGTKKIFIKDVNKFGIFV